jgi:signal peptide peptidase SppA
MNEAILAEMQSQKWVMEPTALKLFFEKLSQISVGPLVASIAVAMPKKMLDVRDGVAHIAISGMLLKTVPGWVRLWGFNATGYDEIASQIAEALAEPKVSAIQLTVSSPGGMVAGVLTASDAIYNARQSKPVTAYVEDLAASGAYWLASQAQSIAAGRTAEIGSIGVYAVYYDWTGWEEKAGIKAVVIRSGEHKGMGMDTITPSQIAAEKEVINGLAGQFVASVAAGRNMDKSKAAELATGRLWIAEAAKELNLIDQVVANNTIITKGDTVMGSTNDQNQNADVQQQIAQAGVTARQEAAAESRKRLSDLKAAFPDDLPFAVAQFEAGSSLIEAKAAYSDVLQKKLNAKANAGAAPLESGDSANDGENFVTLGKQMSKDEKIPLGLAYKKLARERPELHKAYKASLGL